MADLPAITGVQKYRKRLTNAGCGFPVSIAEVSSGSQPGMIVSAQQVLQMRTVNNRVLFNNSLIFSRP